MRIRVDDLTHPAVVALIAEHLESMTSITPPESVHALQLDALRGPGITVWTAWDGEQLLGCGALKTLDAEHAEIKSMRTPASQRRRGAAKALLTHLIAHAHTGGYRRLSLETGAMDEFRPAHHLYAQFGFTRCGPFGEYRDDPNSVFMTRSL